MASDFPMLIGGEAVQADAAFPVVNPATRKTIAMAPDSTEADLDKAVAAARAAFPGWRATPYAERQAVLHRIADRIEAHADELKRLLTAEQGKTHADAEGEVLGTAYWLRSMAGYELPVKREDGDPARRTETHRVPIGVVGGIAPWNFPLLLGSWKFGPAILTGNSVVLKPSPFTPLTTLRLGMLIRDLLPPGVINIVSGADRLGPWMTAHPGIDKISFTGSTATGRAVMASASATLKRVTLELGGNDPAIVLPDVDVVKRVESLFWAAFANSGQICVATKRMYVHDAVYDAVAQALVQYARDIRVGDGSLQGTRLGPVQNVRQFERVRELVEDAKAQGLSFLVGGEVPDTPGYFVPVTIVDNPPESADVVQQEAFGPVLPLIRFTDVDDVIARANATEYGLGASIWTEDMAAAQHLADRLECGTVWINEASSLTPFAAFAGHKQSGIGTENGIEGLLEYTVPRTLVVKRD